MKIFEIIEKPIFKKRDKNTHKGDYGTALHICGSFGMAGAAVLAARSALKSGIGILKCAIPESIYPMLTVSAPEAVCLPYSEVTDFLNSEIKKADSVLVGCGLSDNASSAKLVCRCLENAKNTLIIDAIGIKQLDTDIYLSEQTRAHLILTPHPGEMSYLTGLSVAEIEADRANIARNFAVQHGVTLVLKGSETLVADSNGNVYKNIGGTAGMATGGSGDALSGIISTLACTLDPITAAKYGVYIHAKAGEMAEKRLGEISMLPSDMIDELPGVFKSCIEE